MGVFGFLLPLPKHHEQKHKMGRKGCIWLTLLYHCSSSKEGRTGAQTGQDLEARDDVEAMEEC